MTKTQEILSRAWEPSSEQLATEWIRENVELSSDSELKHFDFDLFPLAKFILLQLCHNEQLKRFTEMVSAQSGKTVTMIAYILWKIINKPSSCAWYTDTGLNAKGDFKTKILPALESCLKTLALLPKDRAKKSNTLIQFGFMNLRVLGAESKANREGKTVSEVLCDEVRNYPPGAMQQIDNRFKTITNWRRILFSSAGTMMNEPWLSFKRGTRHMGFWKCPHCSHKQTFRFGRKASPLYPSDRKCGGFIWTDNDLTHPEQDVWNMAELLPTVRYQCENEKCKYEFKESEKIPLIRSVIFEQTNPMANPCVDVSVHSWEAYQPFSGCSWGNIVEKFLNAVVAMRQGNIEPMKIFRCETEGEPWEDLGEKPVDGEILKRCGDYSRGELWAVEGSKIIGQLVGDMQHGYIHYNFSQFDRAGNKRTIERGKVLNFEEFRLLQRSKGVLDACVALDCAWGEGKKGNAKVFQACSMFGRWVKIPDGVSPTQPARSIKFDGSWYFWDGWISLIGSDSEEFSMNLLGTVKTYVKPDAIDSNIGKEGGAKQVLRVSWSGPHYKHDLYMRRMKGDGPLWEIYKNIEREYVEQIESVERVDIRNAEGIKIGHIWKERGRHDDSDCELMQLSLADINMIGRTA